MKHRPTVAFDLDGTLIDSAPDLLDTLNLVLADIGLAPIGAAAARGLFGGGARMLIERGLALHGTKLTTAEIERMHAKFLAHYEVHLADRSKPFPGAGAALDAIAAQGATLIVITNKFERFSVKLLAALGLAERFALIAGGDTFAVRKPDPGHLLAAVARAGGNSAATVMVGDSATDVTTARRAKVPVVAVSWGYTDVPAQELGADRVVESFGAVPGAVAALLDGTARA